MEGLIYAVFAGISIAFAGLSFFIYFQNSIQRVHLFFGSFSLFSSLYFLLTSIQLYTGAELEVPIIISAGAYYSVFPWFILSLVNKLPKWLFVFPVIFGSAILAFVFKPMASQPAIWQYLAHIGLLGQVGCLIYVTRIMNRNKSSERYELLLLTILFAVLAMDEIISYNTGITGLGQFTFDGYPPLDIYPIMFTLVMGLRVANNVLENYTLRLRNIKGELTKEKLRTEELERQRLETELRFKQKDLTSLGLDLVRRREFAIQIIKMLKELKSVENPTNGELGDLISFAQSNAKIDKDMEVIQKNIDLINHEFLSNIKSQFPQLTDNEIHLVSLLRLNLNIKEIASVKGISPNSVKVLQYRLRKKLGLTEGTNLKRMIQEIE